MLSLPLLGERRSRTEPDEVKPFGQLRNSGFFLAMMQPHSQRNPLERLKSLRCIFATNQNSIIRIAMQRGPSFSGYPRPIAILDPAG